VAKSTIDLLSSIPQPKSTWEKIFDWTFSVGRYLVVFVEAIVLLAFVVRFSLDRMKNDLDNKIKLATNTMSFNEEVGKTDKVLKNFYAIQGIDTILKSQAKYSVVLKEINNQVAGSAVIKNISLEGSHISITGEATNLTKAAEVESKLRGLNYLSNMFFDLSSQNTNNTQQIEFTVSADINQETFFGNFITDEKEETEETNTSTN
jgi:hypothetical protein